MSTQRDYGDEALQLLNKAKHENAHLRAVNGALLAALEKIRAAYTRSTPKYAVQTLDAMDEIAERAIAEAQKATGGQS